MTTARKDIVLPGQEAVYHCVARCVRRAFLCGFDVPTGKAFDHRKAWIRDRAKFLVTIFTIEVFAYAVMCNHLHFLMRTMSKTSTPLTDQDVARRWLLLYPKRKAPGESIEPTEAQIAALALDKRRIEILRERLGSISWFMKSMNEYIARKANNEDECRGHFWEGRFRCQRIADEAAALSCSIYIDLNPIRARIAETPEESTFTSVWERLDAETARHQLRETENNEDQISMELVEQLQQRVEDHSWLAPISQKQGGLFSIDFTQYLQLLDWTGRQLRDDKRGKIPDNLAPILERVGLNSENWIENTSNFGSRFYRFVGNVESILEAARASGKRWFKGLNAARSFFCTPLAA